MRFCRYLLIPFLLYSVAATAAVDSLTLGDALHRAVGAPQIEKDQAASEEASWKRVESYSGFLPSLNGQVSYLTDYKYAVFNATIPGFSPIVFPEIVPTTMFSLNAEWSLFDGFASTNRLRAAELNESAAKKEFNWSRFQVERQVILQFYRALAAKTLRDVAVDNVRTLEDHLRDVQLFRKSGASTNYDVLRVEVQVSSAKSEVANASDNVEIMRGHLAEILGQDKVPDVAGDLPVLNEKLANGLEEESVESRNDIVAQKERSQGMERLESAEGRYWVPKISAFGSYQYYNDEDDGFDNWKDYRKAYEVGLSLNWSFFDGMSSIAKSHEATQQRMQSEHTLRMTTLHAHQDFQVWKRKFAYFCQVYRSRLDDIEKSREAVRLAREGRRVGARTNTDLLDAETDLHRSQADAVNAQIGAIEALVSLELASGKELYNFN